MSSPAVRIRRRRAVWAGVVLVVLSAGLVAMVLLTSATARQSALMLHRQDQVATLHDRAGALRLSLAADADPARLAVRARELRMHPASRVRARRHA